MEKAGERPKREQKERKERPQRPQREQTTPKEFNDTNKIMITSTLLWFGVTERLGLERER